MPDTGDEEDTGGEPEPEPEPEPEGDAGEPEPEDIGDDVEDEEEACGGNPVNECGGCAELEGAVDDPCGTCDSGALACAEDGESLVCEGDLELDAQNACGGCAVLEGTEDDPCGTCDTGVLVCAEDGEAFECEGDLGEDAQNGCGGCEPIDEIPGTACGTCNTGTNTCAEDNESVVCEGDEGEDTLNVCDGCSPLDGEVNQPCGTCGSGNLICAEDGESFICAADLNEEALNECGGCTQLEGSRGDPCGTCDSGILACAPGGEAFECLNDQGEAAENECGGCAELEGSRGDPCGTCDSGVLSCANDDESLECLSDEGEAAQNSCGGCEVLFAEPDETCGGQDCPGIFVCDGLDNVVCNGAEANDCGGCNTLEGNPNESCGICGQFACDGDEAVVCEEQTTRFFFDGDEDGFGVDNNFRELCEAEGNFIARVGGDCNDGNPDFNPDAREVCDTFDNDCDLSVDEGVTNICGGCEDLGNAFGAPCNQCGDGTLGCDGFDALTCVLDVNEDPFLCELQDCLGTCGNGTCEPHETCGLCGVDCGECEDGCGNGEKEGLEFCDDGNTTNDDLCTNTCQARETGDFPSLFPLIRTLRDGGFVVSYQNIQEPDRLSWQRFNSAGIEVGDETAFVTFIPGPRIDLGVVQLDNGNLLMAAPDGSRIFGRAFSNDCESESLHSGSFFSLNEFGSLEGEFHDMTVLEGGEILLVWSASGPFPDMQGAGIVAMRFDEGGDPIDSNPVPVNAAFAGDQINPRVAPLDNGGFVVAWVHGADGEVRLRRFDDRARPIGGDISATITNRGSLDIVRLAVLPNGHIVVGWAAGDGNSYLRIFNAGGVPVTNQEIRINESPDRISDLTTLAVNEDGVILAGFGSCEANCNSRDARFRFFTPSGSPLGGEVTIIPGAGNGPHSAVADESGNFIIGTPLPPNRSDLRLFAPPPQ